VCRILVSYSFGREAKQWLGHGAKTLKTATDAVEICGLVRQWCSRWFTLL